MIEAPDTTLQAIIAFSGFGVGSVVFIIKMMKDDERGFIAFFGGLGFAMLIAFAWVWPIQAEYENNVLAEVETTECDKLKASYDYYKNFEIRDAIKTKFLFDCVGKDIDYVVWWT